MIPWVVTTHSALMLSSKSHFFQVSHNAHK